MTAARKTGLLRFSASRCLALIVKEWHQIGRDPSALVIGVFLPLFMLLVCGFGISMDMKDVPVAIVLEERTPVAQRIAVDFTANPYFDAKVFYAKAPAEKALEAREVECILTMPAGFAANAQQGEAAELGLTVYGVDSNSATLFKSYVLGQLNSSVTKMVSNGMIESAVASRVSAGPVMSLASRSWFNEASISTWYLVPGILVIVVGAASTMMSAIVIAREWERGTMAAIFATPASPLEIFLAKWLSYWTIAFGGSLLSLCTSFLVFGQPLRGSIAGVLAMQPQCVVLDEPTAMLDPQGRREVLDTIERLNRETGMTVILITHHMDEAARADRVIAMSEGRIVADGTPQAVFAQEPLLRSVGLDVPQTEQLLLELKRRGVDIPTDALTPEACAQLLRQRIARS